MLKIFIIISTAIAGFSAFAVAKEIDVTITLPIHDLTQPELLVRAKNKAVHQTLDKLPSIVWGEEHATANGDYHSEVKAIGFAQAAVDVQSELMDRATNSYQLMATVRWDRDKILETLQTVKAGEEAKKTVHQIEKLLNGLMAEDFLSQKGRYKFEEARLLAAPFEEGMNLTEHIKRYQHTLLKMQQLREARVIDYINAITIQPVGMKNERMEYQMTMPAQSTLSLDFESPELNQFYRDNQKSIEQYAVICPVSNVINYHDLNACGLQGTRSCYDHSKSHTFQFSVKPNQPLIENRMAPVYFVPCKQSEKGFLWPKKFAG